MAVVSRGMTALKSQVCDCRPRRPGWSAGNAATTTNCRLPQRHVDASHRDERDRADQRAPYGRQGELAEPAAERRNPGRETAAHRDDILPTGQVRHHDHLGNHGGHHQGQQPGRL